MGEALPIERTFRVPPTALSAAETYVSRPGSELAAGKYTVVSSVPNAHLAFSSGVAVAANDTIELALPAPMTICSVAAPGSVSFFVSGAWTAAATAPMARMAATETTTRVRFVAQEAATLAVTMKARSADAHTLLRLLSVTGTRATVLSSCAVRSAGSVAIGGQTVTGTLGATPRTLVYEGAGITSQSVLGATVTGLVADFPWPGTAIGPTVVASSAGATVTAAITMNGNATTTLVAGKEYAVTLTFEGATVSSVDEVTWTVQGAASGAGSASKTFDGTKTAVATLTPTGLGDLVISVRINGSTTISTKGALSVVATPVVTAGLKLISGTAVAVPLTAISAWAA